MKHMSWLLVLAMLAASPAFSGWTPVPEMELCPATVNEDDDPVNWPKVNTMSGMPKIHNDEVTKNPWVAKPATFPDVAKEPYDFCGIFDVIYCSLGPAGSLSEDILNFANLVQCMFADINGPVDLDADIPVTPNGVLDSYELAIIAAILNDVNHPLNADVTASFQGYFYEIKNLVMEALFLANLKGDKDLRGTLFGLAPYLGGSLVSVLAGFAVMGDPDTDSALDALLGLLAQIGLEPPENGIASLGTPVPALGPLGDADGDGFTNKQEYNYFVNILEYSPEEFAAAALDPNAVPDTPPVPEVTIGGPTGRIAVGDTVTLSANVSVGSVTDYAWKKNGVILDDEVGAALVLANVQLDDSGVYTAAVTVEYEDGNKALVVDTFEGSFTVTVLEYTVPVGSALGLSIFAGACALAGAMGIRRRK
ncbi:MAG TPA: immunoglobulin domain-containing protein [Candidatus Hydrogenedentes bacterium]|nr:immunoglobulin domain-containing protein [Candidatus Hydrogenedentota bacterium]HOR52022.1 immunoglobulin domain-containing protein [Candidatus Hydrogenedentota bacterium]HPK26065.1 immunoglobulin domain-containing protein [Candidatus Hydrogenedentota bacterium]